ncbi:MAG: glycosyltransferase family 9 protein [Betaproteobacteria bacterium]|nr:glycosyltransferase family 9 protein [Betaproteobacteria bacterium]
MRIAVFRALQLGDLLCAVPALRALRHGYPEAHITLIGLPWARELAGRLRAYVDHFIEFPGFPGMPERAPDIAAIPEFFRVTRTRDFDLAIQLHGSGELTNPITALMGARSIAGHYRPGQWRPDGERCYEWRDGEHEVLRWVGLMQRLGLEARGTQLEFPLRDADWQQWRSLRLHHYALLHPGSQLASRRWLSERFAEVGDALAAEGLRIVLTGTAGEAALTARVQSAMREPALDLAGRTTLGTLGALVARARLVVCNDTGISHIAAATHTPSVVIACGSDPRRWAPLNRELHRVLAASVPCRPCAHRACPIGHPCALEVSARQVIAETSKALLCAA